MFNNFFCCLKQHLIRLVKREDYIYKLKKMRIRLITTIMAPFKKVYTGFDRKLFEYLMPPFSLASIERYEGQAPGDIIDLKFNVPFLGNWTVIIKEASLSHREYSFTDRGLRVPFGIDYWKHAHRVVARNNESCFIIDDIEYETSWVLLDYLLYLPLLLIFYPRKFFYKRYFEKKGNNKD